VTDTANETGSLELPAYLKSLNEAQRDAVLCAAARTAGRLTRRCW